MEQLELHDGMFWLPPEFLDDGVEDGVVGFNSSDRRKPVLNSDLGSPVESATETESDEDEYLTELTQKLARSALEEGFSKTEVDFASDGYQSKSTRVLAGSPQSTLCGCNFASSRGSSDFPSPAPAPAPSPASAVGVVEPPPWDVLSAAAGEVARLRMTEDAGFNHRNGGRNHVSPPSMQRITSPNPQLIKQQLLQQQQMMKQQQYQQFVQQNMVRFAGVNMPPVAPPASGRTTVQQSQGMTAVFLGNPTGKRECSGTGVFLPRQIGVPAEPRNKRGCSTVLLPDRVVHALNLNLEAQNRSNGGLHRHDYEAEMRHRSNVLMAEQRRRQAEMDLRLPQEWTY